MEVSGGQIVFTFDEPRDLTHIETDLPAGVALVYATELAGGRQSSSKPLDSDGGTDMDPATDPDAAGVVKVFIRRSDTVPISESDLNSIVVEACLEGKKAKLFRGIRENSVAFS